MPVAKKIAISMPEPMFKDMERARKREGTDRSAWLQSAVEERLRRERRAADIAAYVRGYELHPETEDEIREAEQWLKLGPHYDDDWPEAPR